MKTVKIIIPEKGSRFEKGQIVALSKSEADRLIQAGIAEQVKCVKGRYKSKEEKFNE